MPLPSPFLSFTEIRLINKLAKYFKYPLCGLIHIYGVKGSLSSSSLMMMSLGRGKWLVLCGLEGEDWSLWMEDTKWRHHLVSPKQSSLLSLLPGEGMVHGGNYGALGWVPWVMILQCICECTSPQGHVLVISSLVGWTHEVSHGQPHLTPTGCPGVGMSTNAILI